MDIPYTPPSVGKTQFNCPNCKAFAQQLWFVIRAFKPSYSSIDCDDLDLSLCVHCKKTAYWLNGKLIQPQARSAPPANRDLDIDIIKNYDEAAAIEQSSPKGAAALLRLCVQQLCKQLGGAGSNINGDIAALVKKGLPVEIQQALDVVRVIGNNAVHPGTINFDDSPEVVSALFILINAIADRMITQPKKVAALYGSLPAGIVDAIEKRDKTKD